MSADHDHRGDDSGDRRGVRRRIERKILQARLALFWESFLPAFAPFLAVVAGFVGLSWIGIWPVLPFWLHVALLFLFAAALAWSLWQLHTVQWPSREAARRRVEVSSGLLHRPLEALDDRLPAGSAPTARALWDRHRIRALSALQSLRVAWPSPRIDRRDRFAVRVVAAILLYIGAFAGYGFYGERLGDAFRFERAVADAGLRIDAWVTPPAYTGHPPIFLSMGEEPRQTGTGPLRVPEGSIAIVRAQGVEDLAVTRSTAAGEQRVAAEEAEAEAVPASASAGAVARKAPAFSTYKMRLDENGDIEISAGSSLVSRWTFEVVEDEEPTIALSDPPEVQLSGAIKLTYSMKDDYGVVGALALLTPKEESITVAAESSEARPLVKAPDFKLALPQRRTKSGSSQTFRDLTSHPWAGSLVDLQLTARDEAGQAGESDAVEFRLPERSFSKPMARAIVEQRRNLALDANRRLQVLDAFDAMLIAPERFIDDASIYLGMRYVYGLLQKAESDEELIESLDVMWDLALAIEDGDLSLAERALREAEEALRRALENGASEEEIKRLTEELRQALNDYFRALAEQMMRNPGEQRPMDPNARTLSQRDLQQMLDQIEDLARTGAHDAARELLAQMQQMLENLRAGRPQMQQGKSASEMSDALNKLAEMIQRQRELMDKSFQLDQESRRQGRQGQRNGQQGQQGQQGQGQQGQGQQSLTDQLAEALRQLQQGQGDLKQALEDLLAQLERDGIRGNEALNDAGRLMGDAEGELGRGRPGDAVPPQSEALQALRQGTKGLIEQMINQGQGQGMADGRGNQQRNRDPLGRPYRNDGTDDLGDSVKVPGEIDIQRARRILQELRQKLGDPLRSEMERNYFERLLTPY